MDLLFFFKRNISSIDILTFAKQLFLTSKLFLCLFLVIHNYASSNTYNKRFFSIPPLPSPLAFNSQELHTGIGHRIWLRLRIDFIGYKSAVGEWERERERERETVSSSRRSGASTPIESWCVRAGGVECISRGMTWMAEARGRRGFFKIRQRRKAILILLLLPLFFSLSLLALPRRSFRKGDHAPRAPSNFPG